MGRDLNGAGALVTGGGSGIGLGCARRLAADGAVVTICGRREDVLRKAVGEIGHAARYVMCDVTNPDQVALAVEAAADAGAATRDDYLAQMPLGRLGTVDDIAGAVRFLAGRDAAWITGQVFAVDGGHTLRRGPDLDHVLGRHFESALVDFMGVKPLGVDPGAKKEDS